MKKFSTIFIALSLAMLLAMPAMALETEMSGQYRVRGFSTSNPTLSKNDADASHMDTRLRLKTVFKVNDNVKLTTRFDALDGKIWGNTDDPDTNDKHNIDFDQAYVNIKTSFGMFDIGRMTAKAFGTTFADDNTDRDRIKYTLPLGDMTLLAVVGKKLDTDGLDATVADGDWTGYSLAGVYKMESGVVGLLLHFDSNQMIGDVDMKEFFINPFVKMTVADTVQLQAEVKYQIGEHEYDTAEDHDVSRFAGNIEASTLVGRFTLTGGYAYVSGDADFGRANDDNEDTFFLGGPGGDWDRIWILTGNEDKAINYRLGGCGNSAASASFERCGMEAGASSMDSSVSSNETGNIGGNLTDPGLVNSGNFSTSATQSGAGQFGAQIAYIGASMSPMEGLELGLLIAYSKAAEVPKGWDDEHGIEYDFTLSYKLFDNLTYSAIVAYLAAGDFWKGGNPYIDLENTYAVYNQLKLKF